MAEKEYSYDFEEGEKAEQFKCAICKCVARDPQQEQCSDDIYCRNCIHYPPEKGTGRIDGHHAQCGISYENVKLIEDEEMDESIGKVNVRYPNDPHGYGWRGELDDYENEHMSKLHSPKPETPGSQDKLLIATSPNSPTREENGPSSTAKPKNLSVSYSAPQRMAQTCILAAMTKQELESCGLPLSRATCATYHKVIYDTVHTPPPQETETEPLTIASTSCAPQQYETAFIEPHVAPQPECSNVSIVSPVEEEEEEEVKGVASMLHTPSRQTSNDLYCRPPTEHERALVTRENDGISVHTTAPSLPDDRNVKRISEWKMWLLASVITVSICLLFITALSGAALGDAANKIRSNSAQIIPSSCQYSFPLLLLVLMMQAMVIAVSLFWFTRCCKCAHKRKQNLLARTLMIMVVVLYAVTAIGFACSVFPFINYSNGKDVEPGSSMNTGAGGRPPIISGSESGSGSGSEGDEGMLKTSNVSLVSSEDEVEVCRETHSEALVFALLFLVALTGILLALPLMLCCDFKYKKYLTNDKQLLHATSP